MTKKTTLELAQEIASEWKPDEWNDLVMMARGVIRAHERIAELEAAARGAYSHLMNLQPHIANNGLTEHQMRVIDVHIDMAMEALRKVTEKEKPPAP